MAEKWREVPGGTDHHPRQFSDNLLKGTSKNAPVNDGLAMDAEVLWFLRGFVAAGSTFLAS